MHSVTRVERGACAASQTLADDQPPTGGGAQPAETETVTVRIDQIKELNLLDIQSIYAGGESWCLARRNAKEGVIERQPLDVLAQWHAAEKNAYKARAHRTPLTQRAHTTHRPHRVRTAHHTAPVS
eukprot:4069743-Prymnesium_polylepis.3